MKPAKEFGYKHQKAYAKRKDLIAMPFVPRPLKARFIAIAKQHGMSNTKLMEHVLQEFCTQHENKEVSTDDSTQ